MKFWIDIDSWKGLSYETRNEQRLWKLHYFSGKKKVAAKVHGLGRLVFSEEFEDTIFGVI